MGPTVLASLITGAGVAGIWVAAFMFDLCYTRSYVRLLERQLREKDRQIETERRRADAAVAVAEAGRDVIIGAIRGGTSAVALARQEAAGDPGTGSGRSIPA